MTSIPDDSFLNMTYSSLNGNPDRSRSKYYSFFFYIDARSVVHTQI